MDLYNIGKRILDIFGALVGLLLFGPIIILVGLWVKCVSPEGPVFADIPLRAGKNRKPFFIYKIRSMIPDGYNYLKKNFPELHKKYEENGYKLETHEDPRLIKGAKFLRKSSIDELPQFINVLKGDMSIVGPRAYFVFEIDEQLARYPEAAPYMEEALKVKPGITGVWQISGRSNLSFLERVKLDAGYAKNRSLWYDILIILKTPYAVISGRGAQ